MAYSFDCCIHWNWNVFSESSPETRAQSRFTIIVSRVAEGNVVRARIHPFVGDPINPIFPRRITMHRRRRRRRMNGHNRPRISGSGATSAGSWTSNGNGSRRSCRSFRRFFGPRPDFSSVLVARRVDLGVVVQLVGHNQPLLQLRRQRRQRCRRGRRVNGRASVFVVDVVLQRRQRHFGRWRCKFGLAGWRNWKVILLIKLPCVNEWWKCVS